MASDNSADERAASHRWHAIECNNLAWSLSEQAARSASEDDDMLHAAHAAAFHWSRVGNELHRARADMLLARVHALLGNGKAALLYARRCHEYLMGNNPPDWEKAFSHAVLAHASLKAGERVLHATHYAEARKLGESIADSEDRAIFFRTFGTIPGP